MLSILSMCTIVADMSDQDAASCIETDQWSTDNGLHKHMQTKHFSIRKGEVLKKFEKFE